ncbi:hypothetical protein HKI87_01g00690 [Chloropicon roscoffensis]|uniref:Uncharacterized protein n=1 Tax=Chloropicon roscoffensis TaxID=1461544 RepID=A0AAX4NYM2_9CHLO
MVRLSQGREGGVPDKVAQIIDRIDLEAEEEDGEARRSECPPATAPTSPTAVGGSGVEDALRAENACHKRLRVLDRELQDLVAGLCRDYGALEGRREPLDDVSCWILVHSTAKALDAVEKDFDLKRRIVARTDWRTPGEDTFVYGALLSLEPFLRARNSSRLWRMLGPRAPGPGGESDAVFALFGKLLYSYKLYCCVT